MVTYMYYNGFEVNPPPPSSWSSLTCRDAAKNGHLHILQWLRNQDPPCFWESKTCSYTAKNGLLHVLKWLRSQNPPCDWYCDTCANSRNGHLHVIKWLAVKTLPVLGIVNYANLWLTKIDILIS